MLVVNDAGKDHEGPRSGTAFFATRFSGCPLGLLLSVDPERPRQAVIRQAAAILRAGGLVAFPTETVYGLGANALLEAAVLKVFSAKSRPARNPLIAHVADKDMAQRLVRTWPEAAEALARAFWPGPITIVLPRRSNVPHVVTAGLDTVAVRVPAHPTALALLREADVPVAAPSANRSGQVSPTTAAHVRASLGDRIDLIIDGGATQVGIESAVVDLSGRHPALLRPGPVALADLENVIGPVALPPAPAPDAPLPSPGTMARHYSPRAQLRLFHGHPWQETTRWAESFKNSGKVVGALLLSPGPLPVDHTIRMPKQPADYGRQLYAALHAMDDAGCALILVERVPPSPDWAAVSDRLERAATPD